jgi:hypothetical protein
VFHPGVIPEVGAILSHYENVSGLTLAGDFYREFLYFVAQAAQYPNIYGVQSDGLRRVNLRRFPYNFLFYVEKNVARILVVRHHSRPAYHRSPRHWSSAAALRGGRRAD